MKRNLDKGFDEERREGDKSNKNGTLCLKENMQYLDSLLSIADEALLETEDPSGLLKRLKRIKEIYPKSYDQYSEHYALIQQRLIFMEEESRI